MIIDMEEYREEIEAIKIAVGSVPYMNVSINMTMVKAISWLEKYYLSTKDDTFLHLSLIHIQAFLEMGFSYDSEKVLFDRILSDLELSKEEVFPKRFYSAEKVKLTKNQIRRIIRKWSPSKYHTKPIGEVIEDIMDKVENQKKGVYFYHSNNNPNVPDYDIVYELVINEEECFFHDIQKKKYYTFFL